MPEIIAPEPNLSDEDDAPYDYAKRLKINSSTTKVHKQDPGAPKPSMIKIGKKADKLCPRILGNMVNQPSFKQDSTPVFEITPRAPPKQWNRQPTIYKGD